MRWPLQAMLALLATSAGAAEPTPDIRMGTLCAPAMTLPAEQLDPAAALRERDELGAQAREVTLDFACRGWVAHALRADSPPGATLDWQALVAEVLVGAQRRSEALALGEQAYTQAQPLAEDGRLARRRAAIALTLAHLQVRDQAATQVWAQRAVDETRPDEPLDTEGALALSNRATADLMAGRFGPAAEQLEQLLTRLQPGLTSPALRYPAAVALNQLVYAYAVQGRWQQALATAERLVAHRRQHLAADRAGLALALGNQASALTNLQRYDEALALMRQALVEADGPGSSDVNASGALAQMRGNLSTLLLARGQPREALIHAEAAAASTQGGARLNALHQIASAQIALGDLGAALDTWRRAQQIVDLDPPQGEAWLRLRVLLGQAQALLTLGDLQAARAVLERAGTEAARAPANLAERGQRLVVLAQAQELAGQPAAALATLDEADRALAEQFPPEHVNRLDLLVRACGLGRGCAALPALLQASPTRPARLIAAASLALARDHLRQGDAAAAQTQAVAAVRAATDAASPLLQWQAYAVYAQSLQARRRPAEAIFFGKLALERLQFTRNRLAGVGPDADALYLTDKLGFYREVAGWLLDAGRVPEGLAVLQLLKRSEQDDFNEHRGPTLSAGLPLTAREQAWQTPLDAALRQHEARAQEIERLSRLQAARRITTEEASRLLALQAEQAAQAPMASAQLEQALALVHSPANERPRAARGGPPTTRPADARTLHVYLLSGPERLQAVLVGRQGQRVVQNGSSAAELTRQVAALLDAVRLQQDIHGPAQALQAQIAPLFEPTAREWKIRRLVVWLDGPLRYLPLGLLYDGRQFLVERYALSVATPVERRASTSPAAGREALQVRAWGVTQALAGLPALPGVGDELCGIVDGPVRGWETPACHGVLPGQADINSHFTEAAWREAGPAQPPGGVVHVGTHFVLRPGNVSQSWLLLGDGGRLPLERLRQWPLGSPRLLTLSACETAVPAGAGADGREVDGLSGTLLASGAGQVLASLWRVDDRRTAALMRRFYALAARPGSDLADALQTAQTEALRGGQPAHAWAAFVLSEPAPR